MLLATLREVLDWEERKTRLSRESERLLEASFSSSYSLLSCPLPPYWLLRGTP